MPELLEDGLPERVTRSKFDFSTWADGRAYKFKRGEDYDSTTETFRSNVRRWARDHGYEVDLRAYPALDREGREMPLTKADAPALGVLFTRANGASGH